MNLIKIKDLLSSKSLFKVLMLFILIFSFSSQAFSLDSPDPQVSEEAQMQPKNLPSFNSPVCLLVGLNSNELSYRELSALSGFELFSVPYRSDIKILVEQINPTQVVIKHPSGFVGLYSIDGQLIRGVQTAVNGRSEVTLSPQAVPPSIIQPTEANPIYENVYYAGSLTGTVPHGGLGYTPPPQGRGVKRHLLKLASLFGTVPFQYPGYFNNYKTYNQTKIAPAIFLPNSPLILGAAATYVDAMLDASEYENVRSQPRDYMFQPVIEGY